MGKVLVTLKSNVRDVSEDGEIILENEDAIGYLVKTHSSLAAVPDEAGNTQIGFVTKAEVYWEHRRNPAPSFEEPSDLVWLEMTDSEEAHDEDQEDAEEYDDEHEDTEHDRAQ